MVVGLWEGVCGRGGGGGGCGCWYWRGFVCGVGGGARQVVFVVAGLLADCCLRFAA